MGQKLTKGVSGRAINRFAGEGGRSDRWVECLTRESGCRLAQQHSTTHITHTHTTRTHGRWHTGFLNCYLLSFSVNLALHVKAVLWGMGKLTRVGIPNCALWPAYKTDTRGQSRYRWTMATRETPAANDQCRPVDHAYRAGSALTCE